MGKVENGPAEGLKKKMDYWAEKDYRQEWNIATAQAVNLALQANPEVARSSGQEKVFLEICKHYFRLLLQMRLDTEIRAEFEEYYLSLQTRGGIGEEIERPL